jgi:hypothetical protein
VIIEESGLHFSQKGFQTKNEHLPTFNISLEILHWHLTKIEVWELYCYDGDTSSQSWKVSWVQKEETKRHVKTTF